MQATDFQNDLFKKATQERAVTHVEGGSLNSLPKALTCRKQCSKDCLKFKGILLSYKPQLKNCWKSMEPDKMGRWKAFWNLQGFTRRVKAKVDFGLHAAADVSGWKPVEIG
jgi:hypothetical protein